MATKTIRRDKLKRDIAKGPYMVKLCYHYCDDARYDQGPESDFKEAVLGRASEQTAHDPSKKYLPEYYFEDGCRAWEDENGIVSLVVHSNLAYELKKKEA